MDGGQVSDGFMTLAGGMNAATENHYLIGQDQAEVLVNATVRNGWAEPRPRFRRVEVTWMHRFAQQSFEGGHIQGSARYDSDVGPRIVYAAEGRLISFDPETGQANLLTPDGVTRPFLATAPMIYLQQRGRYLVAQDGLNPPVVVDGDNSWLDRTPRTGIPVGTMMADGWHRLVVVAPDRERIFISDHDLDPSSTPLGFSDGSEYFLNSRYFRVPREIGKIVGVTFAPSFNFQDDLGPLVVFCERGTRTYSIQFPREEWVARDIAATMLPTIGACSPGAIVSRGNDMVFSDHEGRIQTFRAAISRRDAVRIQHVDQPVHNLFKRENAALRRYRRAERFDDRVLTTVWPERVRRPNGIAVRHRCMIVMEEEFLSDRLFVWAGVWTGIFPVAINVVGCRERPEHSVRDRCFAASLDEDGVNRIYEIHRESGHDLMPDPRRVPMWVYGRWLDWKAAFDPKKFTGASVRLGPVRGRVSIQGMWETIEAPRAKWFQHEDAGPRKLNLCRGVQTFHTPGRPRLNLPAPSQSEGFYLARPILKVTGNTSVRELKIDADLAVPPKKNGTQCMLPGEVHASLSCGADFWNYDGDNPAEPPVSLCN